MSKLSIPGNTLTLTKRQLAGLVAEINRQAQSAPRLITKKMLAMRYSVSERTIQSLTAAGVIPCVRLSGAKGRGLLLYDLVLCDRAVDKYGGIKALPPLLVRRKLPKTTGTHKRDKAFMDSPDAPVV
jgi:hypothetical protein